MGAWGWQLHHLHVPNVVEIWEPRPPGTLWATPGLLRDSFTLPNSNWSDSTIFREISPNFKLQEDPFSNSRFLCLQIDRQSDLKRRSSGIQKRQKRERWTKCEVQIQTRKKEKERTAYVACRFDAWNMRCRNAFKIVYEYNSHCFIYVLYYYYYYYTA